MRVMGSLCCDEVTQTTDHVTSFTVLSAAGKFMRLCAKDCVSVCVKVCAFVFISVCVKVRLINLTNISVPALVNRYLVCIVKTLLFSHGYHDNMSI